MITAMYGTAKHVAVFFNYATVKGVVNCLALVLFDIFRIVPMIMLS